MKNFWGVITGILVPVLTSIVNAMSPTIRTALQDFLLKLHDDATATPNPYDDLVTGLLLHLFGFDESKT